MYIKVRIHNYRLWKRVRKLLKELTDEDIKKVLNEEGNLSNAMDKIEDIIAAEQEGLKFFKKYF